MSAQPRIVLRYFDARGRAQFIRAFFAARAIEFTDERVPLSPGFAEWAAMRADRGRTGPFEKLPVVHWGERTLVGEALAIRAFLHRALGDAERLDDDENLRHEMLCSSLYVDVLMPLGILIWAELALPGVDLAALARQTLGRLRTQFAALDRTLAEWDWAARAADRPPMIADALLWEETNAARLVFGAALGLDDLPTLAKLERDGPGVGAFERLQHERPASVTGRGLAAETATLARIRSLIAS